MSQRLPQRSTAADWWNVHSRMGHSVNVTDSCRLLHWLLSEERHSLSASQDWGIVWPGWENLACFHICSLPASTALDPNCSQSFSSGSSWDIIMNEETDVRSSQSASEWRRGKIFLNNPFRKNKAKCCRTLIWWLRAAWRVKLPPGVLQKC